MKIFFSIYFIIFTALAKADQACLDLSGTYLLDDFVAGKSSCSGNRLAVKGWYRLVQLQCAILTMDKIYKLDDGTFCETKGIRFLTDGLPHQTSLSARYTYNLDEVQHEILFEDLMSKTSRLIKRYQDKDHNLISEAENETHVFQNAPIE